MSNTLIIFGNNRRSFMNIVNKVLRGNSHWAQLSVNEILAVFGVAEDIECPVAVIYAREGWTRRDKQVLLDWAAKVKKWNSELGDDQSKIPLVIYTMKKWEEVEQEFLDAGADFVFFYEEDASVNSPKYPKRIKQEFLTFIK